MPNPEKLETILEGIKQKGKIMQFKTDSHDKTKRRHKKNLDKGAFGGRKFVPAFQGNMKKLREVKDVFKKRFGL